jgi:two-component system response regulator YesN
MPLVDGLELTRHLREHYPSVFVVILTGFNEFSYAQQAVKLRVNDFVLKPVSPKDFYAILTKLSHELSERDSRRNNIRTLQTRVNQAETTLRNTLFRHILRNAISSDELQQAAAKAGLRLDWPVYCALFCQPGSPMQGVTAVQHMQDVTLEIASRFSGCVSAVVDDHYAVLLMGGKTKDEVSQRAKDAASMLTLAISRAFGTPAQAGIGTCCSSLSGLHRCFKEAFHALGYGFASGNQVIVDHLALAAERPPTPENPLPSEREILQALQAHDEGGARTLVERLFASFSRRGLHVNACIPPLERLRFALMDLVPADKLRAAPQIPPTTEWFYADKIQQAYLQLVSFVYRLSVQDTEDPALRCVENAKGYIQQHYHDSEFSLTELLSFECE